jgi:hypothetical protein
MTRLLVVLVAISGGAAFAQDGGSPPPPPPPPADGGTTTDAGHPGPAAFTYQFRGLGANGSSYSNDSCGYSGAYVWANESTSHNGSNGQPITSSMMSLQAWNYNWCTGQYTSLFASGDSVNISGNSSQVRVTGNVQAWDWWAGSISYAVDFTFTGDGNYTRGESTQVVSSPWGLYRTRYVGSTSQATMVGTVSQNGATVLTLGNSGAFYGQITNSSSGSVQLMK